MADTITSAFDAQMPLPIDLRMRRQSIAQRDTISEFIRWEGMMVYVIDNQTTYQLVGGIQNSQWVALDIGTGPGDFVPLSWVDPDPDLAADSDQKIATQHAVKVYVDAVSNQLSNYQLISQKGQANGYAPLDGNGNVPLDNMSNRVFRTGGSDGATLGHLGALANDLNNFVGARATHLGPNVSNMPMSGVEGAVINLFENPDRSPQIWLSSVPNSGNQSMFFRGRQGNDWLKLADERYGIGTIITQDSDFIRQVEDTGLYMAPDSDPNAPPEFLPTQRVPYLNIAFLNSRTQLAIRACETACGATPGPYYAGYQGKDLNDNWSEWISLWDRKNLQAPYGNSLQRMVMSADVSKDGMWNQWIEPLGVRDTDGNIWFGSVGDRSELYITKKYADGRTARRQIGEILSNLGNAVTDDHNAPAILLDNRTDAEYPIIVFQCDHNTTPVRYWRFTTLDINAWDVSSWDTIGSQNVAYVQCHRFGDEIFVWSRIPALPRPWRIAYSDDNGDTWTTRTIFSTPASWLYLLGKQKANGNGVNIAMHGHPINSTNQNIYFLELDFVSGEVRNPATGVVIADIRAAIADTGFNPIDPFSVGLEVYQAQGSEITRLWDINRANTGNCGVVFNVSPSSDATMQNFRDSTYNITTFSLSNGNIVQSVPVYESGVPIENPKGNNFYFAGARMVASNEAIICSWKSRIYLSNRDDITNDYGATQIRRCTVNLNNGNVSVGVIVSNTERKIIRPYMIGADTMLVAECEYYQEYTDYYSDIVIMSVGDSPAIPISAKVSFLRDIPGYDMSVQQVLSHDISGSFEWINS